MKCFFILFLGSTCAYGMIRESYEPEKYGGEKSKPFVFYGIEHTTPVISLEHIKER